MAVWSEVTTISLIETKRFDAEFYSPKYLEIEKRIKKTNYVRFGSIINMLTDYHANGSYEVLRHHVKLLDEPDYAYMVRTADLEKENYTSDVKYVDEHAYRYLQKSTIHGYEILINKIGSAGKVYLMPKLRMPVTLGMNLFMIRTVEQYSTFFVYAYLCSRFGKQYIERFVNGTVPLTITKDSVRNVLIPKPNNKFHDEVTILVKKSLEQKKLSKSLYTQAQQLLEQELGLDKLEFKKPVGYEANFSEVVNNNRADADYYQSKFRFLEKHIRNINTKPLSQIANFTKGIEVGSLAYKDEGKLFLRVSNVKETGIETGLSDKYISNNLFSSLQKFQLEINELLLTKDGTPGICYVVDQIIDGIISGGIVKIKIIDTSVPSEYLALVINSKICRMQVERVCSGALIIHWKPGDISKLQIPILSDGMMKKLSKLVAKSKQAKRESQQLLNQAKTRVEQLIEEAAGKNG